MRWVTREKIKVDREFVVYDALYTGCKRRVSRGLVAEAS
jgi:hypothetical protein